MKSLFYRPIKLTAKSHEICFWSDTHFNHECSHWPVPLWKARGFSSVEDHTEGLIARWNNKADENATFFHLGDFIFGFNSALNFKSIVERLRFKDLYIMSGNHFSGWKQVFEEQKGNIWRVDSNRRVIFVPNYLEAHINGQHIVMSHYPILSFNGQSKGSVCLYGHVHGNLIKNEIGKLYSNAKTMEICVETCPSPINFQEIQASFRHKTGVSFDHHTNI